MIHAKLKIEQRNDPAAGAYVAADRLIDARERAQQRGLAGSVMTQQADAIAFANFEAYAIERFDHDPARLAGADLTADAQFAGGKAIDALSDLPEAERMFERPHTVVIDRKLDVDIFADDRQHRGPRANTRCGRGSGRRTGTCQPSRARQAPTQPASR